MENKLSYPLPHKIHMVAHMLKLRTERLFAQQLNISFTDYMFLHILLVKGSQSQQVLSECACVTPAATSKRITNLLEAELIQTETNPDNRRENIISLTEKGKTLEAQATTLVQNDFSELFGDLPKSFESTLNKLIVPLMQEGD